MTYKKSQGISVIMPTFNQGEFLSRAVASLLLQSHKNWELIIINDGATDDTKLIVSECFTDKRIRYFENYRNEGIGVAINKALSLSKHEYIAYLPSDDIYFENHLEKLLLELTNSKQSILAYSGVKHSYFDNALASSYRKSFGRIEGYSLQLVQVMHKKVPLKWLERARLVTDDLDEMYWNSLSTLGSFVETGVISCEWVDHPNQRHKIINERLRGGIYLYRKIFGIDYPLRFKSTTGILIDEQSEYSGFNNRATKVSPNGLKILIVGELAYNPERILAFEEAGHKLYGLWISSPSNYNTIGPLQFGNVEDIPSNNWIERIKEIQPDIIYALLNHQAVSLAHSVLSCDLGIPFVWHFKEGPFYSRQYGKWKELIELCVYSDGQIYTNNESREWFQQFIDKSEQLSTILDGDLPKANWFTEDLSPKKSSENGDIHTVVPGRPMGLTPENVGELAKQKIHLHLYGDVQQAFWKNWIEKSTRVAPGYLHLHKHCAAKDWVNEFSQYDAGWLHYYESDNFGEFMRASWWDLNYPARMPTLAAAGLPMIQKNNKGHIAATYSLIESKKMGISFSTFDELGSKLHDKSLLNAIGKNVWSNRMFFTFDSHVEELINFFKTVIEKKRESLKRDENH